MSATRQINGLHLWVEQVNKAGGVKLPDGTKVKVVTSFTMMRATKDRVQELYTRLISTDKADFLVSPYSSAFDGHVHGHRPASTTDYDHHRGGFRFNPYERLSPWYFSPTPLPPDI